MVQKIIKSKGKPGNAGSTRIRLHWLRFVSSLHVSVISTSHKITKNSSLAARIASGSYSDWLSPNEGSGDSEAFVSERKSPSGSS